MNPDGPEMRVTVAEVVLDQIVREAVRGVPDVTVPASGPVRTRSGRKAEVVEARAVERRLHLTVHVRAKDEEKGLRSVPLLVERIREAVRTCTGMVVGDVQVELTEE